MRFWVGLTLAMISVGCEGARPREAGAPRRIEDASVASGVDAGFDDAGGADAGRLDGGPARDAGAPADGGAPPGPCPALAGFDRVGRSWLYESTDAYEASTETALAMDSELIRIEAQGSLHIVEVAFTQEVTGATYRSINRGRTTYRCDAEGLHVVSQVTESETLVQDTAVSSTSETTYTPPLRILPMRFEAGDSFSARATQRTQGVSNGNAFDDSSEIAHTTTARGRAAVTLPSGARYEDALEVHADYGSSASTGYYVEGVGRVLDDQVELIRVQ